MNEVEDRAYPMREMPMVEVDSYFQPHSIEIKILNRGYLVGVGCKTFAFTDRDEMMKHIYAYLTNPKEVTELFNNNKLF